MSTWTAIPTSVLEVGQPIRSIDIIALRDNILAVPAGAAGAPRVQGAALANPLTMPGNLRIENAAPQIVWRETDQALPAGLWRVVLDGNRWDIRRNTAPAGDFTTETAPLLIQSDDRVRLAHGLTIHESPVNVTGTAPFFACRAWVNFDGATGAIRASGNVASVTRHAIGDYTINFATAMPDANYSLSGNTTGGVFVTGHSPATQTASAVRLQTIGHDGILYERSVISVAIFR